MAAFHTPYRMLLSDEESASTALCLLRTHLSRVDLLSKERTGVHLPGSEVAIQVQAESEKMLRSLTVRDWVRGRQMKTRGFGEAMGSLHWSRHGDKTSSYGNIQAAFAL